jgi:hypothetical protein
VACDDGDPVANGKRKPAIRQFATGGLVPSGHVQRCQTIARAEEKNAHGLQFPGGTAIQFCLGDSKYAAIARYPEIARPVILERANEVAGQSVCCGKIDKGLTPAAREPSASGGSNPKISVSISKKAPDFVEGQALPGAELRKLAA